jgi:hypothetical protein
MAAEGPKGGAVKRRVGPPCHMSTTFCTSIPKEKVEKIREKMVKKLLEVNKKLGQ